MRADLSHDCGRFFNAYDLLSLQGRKTRLIIPSWTVMRDQPLVEKIVLVEWCQAEKPHKFEIVKNKTN